MTDGLVQLAQGLGVPGFDKMASATYTFAPMDPSQATAAFMSSWLARRIVEIPSQDATMRPPRLTLNEDVEDMPDDNGARATGPDLESEASMDETSNSASAVTDLMVNANVLQALCRAHTWGRLTGGGVAIIVTKKPNGDADDLKEPLDVTKLQKDSFAQLLVTDRYAISKSITKVENPADKNFGQSDMFTVNRLDNVVINSTFEVHVSRMIIFRGVNVPSLVASVFDGWGDSVLSATMDSLKAKDAVSANIARMTFESNVDTMKVKDLTLKLATPESTNKFLERMSAVNLIKGNNRLLLIDEGDELDRHAYTFSGLKDVVECFCADVSGAAEISQAKLFGRSPSGLGSSGNAELTMDDTRNLRICETDFRPAYNILYPVLIRSALGRDVPFSFEFPPLREMTEKEEAELEKARADRDKIYRDMGAIGKGLVARELQARGTYQAMTDDDVEAVQEMEAMSEEAAKALMGNAPPVDPEMGNDPNADPAENQDPENEGAQNDQ